LGWWGLLWAYKISFRDTDINEKGFRVVDAETNERLSVDVIPLEGTGTAGIIKVVGLSAGTDYSVKVEAFFEDKDSSFSEPFPFKTKGDSIGVKAATDLKVWRVRETTALLAFKDNSSDEIRYDIRHNRNGRVLATGSAVEGQDGYAAIKLRNLLPGITIPVVIETVHDHDSKIILSKEYNITTKGEAEEGSKAVVSVEETTENSVTFSFRFSEEPHIGGDSNDMHPALDVKIHNMKTEEIIENIEYIYDNFLTNYHSKITGLNPNTEYTFAVETVYEDGTPLTLSESFTFRTKPSN